jgi:hypothetical protein
MALCGASTQLSKYAALSPCTVFSVHRQTPDSCLARTSVPLVASNATGTCRAVRKCLVVNPARSGNEQNVGLQAQLPAALRKIRLWKGRVQTLAINRKGAVIRVEQNSNAANDKVEKPRLGRRKVLELAALVAVASNGVFGASPAHAYKPPPEGKVLALWKSWPNWRPRSLRTLRRPIALRFGLDLPNRGGFWNGPSFSQTALELASGRTVKF